MTRLRATQGTHGLKMEAFYKMAQITRQGYFQALERQNQEDQLMSKIKPLVERFRKEKDSRAGSRTLYYWLKIKDRYGIGVTKFENLMSDYGLSLKPLRVRVVTTQSTKQSWNYLDLSKGRLVNGINQLVVGDLTYINYGKDRYFLFCLTDIYSARIVGHAWSERMRAQDAKEAFDRWIRSRGRRCVKGCIHHTDGGSQYFSELYLSAMQKAELQVSVAKSCLDNGFAEQRNAVVKHHLLPVMRPGLKGDALRKEFKRILQIYNQERTQQNLGWKSPADFEKYWSDKDNRPILRVYDRDQKMHTVRYGF